MIPSVILATVLSVCCNKIEVNGSCNKIEVNGRKVEKSAE